MRLGRRSLRNKKKIIYLKLKVLKNCLSFSLAKVTQLKDLDLVSRYEGIEEKEPRYKSKCHI